MSDAERELAHDAEHRVTPLELFFDLVFVFAFTGSLLSTLTSGEARRSAAGSQEPLEQAVLV